MSRGIFGFVPNPDLFEVEATEFPVGSVVAWLNGLDGVPDLPDGWLECNGQRVTDRSSPLYGTTLPDLNGKHLYLRGGPVAGVEGS